mmetsp:Transcript_39615/g.59534  ORF Transcript_39615/g.59534 Transcript_39615/m.59534 type:complete len:83 (+) Transcript_39615:46-294(+)
MPLLRLLEHEKNPWDILYGGFMRKEREKKLQKECVVERKGKGLCKKKYRKRGSFMLFRCKFLCWNHVGGVISIDYSLCVDSL